MKTSGKMDDVNEDHGYGWIDKLALVMIADIHVHCCLSSVVLRDPRSKGSSS